MPMNDRSSAAQTFDFVPLADCEKPDMPADQSVRRWVEQMLKRLRREESEPFVASDDLDTATTRTLDRIAAPPACGPLLADFAGALGSWRTDPGTGPRGQKGRIRLVVMPPCDDDVVATWACHAGIECLDPPSRMDLASGTTPDLSAFGNEHGTPIVIPRLEDWLLRHRRALTPMRALMAAIHVSRRPILIGCNAWAWHYLSRTLDADLVLPDPETFQPFDAARLRDWFRALAVSGGEGSDVLCFRVAETGEDVLRPEDERDDDETSDWLETFAARSRGIPWVAWAMWRTALRSSPEAADTDAAVDRARHEGTLWLASPEEFELPPRHERRTLLVLHALLVHGSLAPAEMALVLPEAERDGDAAIVAALQRAGFIAHGEDDRLRCRAVAYPQIRSALRDMGYPMARL